MILKGKKTHIYMVSYLKHRAETGFRALFSSPSSADLPSVSPCMRFTSLLRYTEGRGLGAVPHAASGEFLGEGEDSLMFVLRGREAYICSASSLRV